MPGATLSRRFRDLIETTAFGSLSEFMKEPGHCLSVGPPSVTKKVFQIGDGAIVVSNRAEPGDYCWVFWPQHGEFANQTNFITQDDAFEVLEFEVEDRCIGEVALFTDGIERLVLDFTKKTAHFPFFRTLFDWLVETEISPIDVEIPTSSVMEKYLGSKPINDRTDDDKTLILASRRGTPTEESALTDADQTTAAS